MQSELFAHTDLPQNPQIFAGQYKMTQLQVFNWGTFSGLHNIDISRKGFLFIGGSGTGKSTLLDAMSTLLVPPQQLSFNAAAREGDKGRFDRNLALYMRGAWGDQTDNDSGEIATQFLRKGSTWSAISIRYETETNKVITLIGLFLLRGNHTRSSEVKRHFFVAQRNLSE